MFLEWLESIGSHVAYWVDYMTPILYVIPIQSILGQLAVVPAGDTGTITKLGLSRHVRTRTLRKMCLTWPVLNRTGPARTCLNAAPRAYCSAVASRVLVYCSAAVAWSAWAPKSRLSPHARNMRDPRSARHLHFSVRASRVSLRIHP